MQYAVFRNEKFLRAETLVFVTVYTDVYIRCRERNQVRLRAGEIDQIEKQFPDTRNQKYIPTSCTDNWNVKDENKPWLERSRKTTKS